MRSNISCRVYKRITEGNNPQTYRKCKEEIGLSIVAFDEARSTVAMQGKTYYLLINEALVIL